MYFTKRENCKFEVFNKDNHTKEICFTSIYKSGISQVDKVKALLYESENPKGAIVFIHGAGDRNLSHLKYYPQKLMENGFTTIMPILPYHSERKPNNDDNTRFLQGDSCCMEKKFYQAVIDVMTCVDYLEEKGYENINVMGFSLGGMIATISMALDKRIKKGILTVTGGNFEYITWHSIATKVFRLNYEEDESCNPEKCHSIHNEFDNICSNINSYKDIDKLPSCFRYDPSLFAKEISREKIIMFTAIFDIFIPKKSSEDLWERLGKPKRYKLFSGHLTSHLIYKKLILDKALNFLK